MNRWTIFFCVIMSCCASGSVAAKSPEMGGPKKFDLDCRGKEDMVVKEYIPFHHSSIPGPEIVARRVRKHVVIDIDAMKFLEIPRPYSGSPPIKIASYDTDFGFLMLRKAASPARRWAIKLRDYKSIAVSEYDSGEIWVERMSCRLMPFSSFD